MAIISVSINTNDITVQGRLAVIASHLSVIDGKRVTMGNAFLRMVEQFEKDLGITPNSDQPLTV